MRCVVPLAALALAAACNETTIDTDPDEQIEITGYMDARLVEFTAVEQVNAAVEVELTVLGRPGSTGNQADVTVSNPRTGDTVVVPAEPDGAFLAQIDVLDDDVVTVTAEGADAVELEVGPLRELPPYEEEVLPPDDQGDVLVQIFFGEHPALDLRLSNPSSGDVTDMTPLPERDQYVGEVTGQTGDLLLVHGVIEAETTLAGAFEVPEEVFR